MTEEEYRQLYDLLTKFRSEIVDYAPERSRLMAITMHVYTIIDYLRWRKSYEFQASIGKEAA